MKKIIEWSNTTELIFFIKTPHREIHSLQNVMQM